ncbi:MAG: hypothetical protein AAF211_15630, partial [Myxococcota bacterium]
LIGGLLYRLAIRQAAATLEGTDARTVQRLAEATVAELPLRGFVTLARALSWPQLELLLDLINGRAWGALRRVVSWRSRADR